MLRKVNAVYVTECVCFPRSGHRLLADMLESVLGARIMYCEMYEQPALTIDQCPGTNYQKNHDFDLDTPIRDDRKYLVQIRNPIPAIASRWALETENGAIANTEEEYRYWSKLWATHWAGFMAKWVYSPVPNRLILRYEMLISEPYHALSQVVTFLGNVPDPVSIARAVDAAAPVERPHKPLLYAETV